MANRGWSFGLTPRETAFLVLWASGVALLAWAGSWVDGYLVSVRQVPLPHPYPWRGVLTACAVESLIALVFYVLIRPRTYRASWGRALAATLLGASSVVVLGQGLMHQPPYLYALFYWLVAVTTISLGLFLMSAGIRVQLPGTGCQPSTQGQVPKGE